MVRTRCVEAVRDFNRFYTRRIGLLGEGLLRTKFSLANEDRRASRLGLSPRGREEFQRLNARSQAEIAQMLSGMSRTGQRELVESMSAIRRLVERRRPRAVRFGFNSSPAWSFL
ncbi:MAG TPA: hypothetical protein VMH28_27880 [Candidatus Acidoferrales bacterium]|nr:hypothetical protein [Candidatus Acidoferrales bacterium]